jgi:hypothetical protein
VSVGNTTSGINAELLSADEGGQISGVVTKASGGEPIRGIDVCADETSGSEFFGGCSETNANGEYTISGLAGGTFKVSFSGYSCGSGTCTQQNYVYQYYNDKPTYDEADEVTVTASKTTSGIDAKMAEGGRITGKVTSASGGTPLANVYACADEVVAEVDDCAFTDSSGEYAIEGLPSGSSYKVAFTDYSGNYLDRYYNEKSSYSESDTVSVTVSKTTSGINAKMLEGGQITGRVTDASTHAPIMEVDVCADESSNEFELCGYTNSNGEYTISSLPTGSYNVTFYPESDVSNYLSESHDGVSVTAGTTASVNAELHAGGEITGRVTDASTHAGLTKVEVCAEEVGGTHYSRCGSTLAGTASAGATSNALVVPAPNSAFTLVKAPVFEPKTDDIVFFFKVSDAGTFSWSLSFKNADVGFASAVESSLGRIELAVAEAAKKKAKPKKCKAGYVRHDGKCVHSTVPFGAGSRSVPVGIDEIKVHAGSQALKGLKAGHTLHVSGPFTFQSALGGSPVAHTESLAVHLPKKKSKKHGKK